MRVSSMPIVGKIPRPASDRPDQNFWPAAPTSGLATRVLLWGHVRNFRRIPFSPRERLPFVHLFPRVSRSKEEGVEERESVACSTNFTNFREMEGGASSRASSTSGRPTLWSRRNRELERDKGELGWKLGVVRESIWESNSREMGRIFFSIVLSSGCNSYVVWFVTDASNTSLNGSQSQRVLTMPARLR